MNKRASLEEVQSQIADVTAKIEELKKKGESPDGLSPDENKQFDELVTQLEQLKEQEQQGATEQRYAAIKVKDEQPRNPAPRVAVRSKGEQVNVREAMAYWLRHHLDKKLPLTSEEEHKVRSAGFSLLSDTIILPVNYEGLNYKKRSILNKGGSGAGLEWLYTTQSNKVTEYLTYSSPILGMLNSETTDDGNPRDYYRVDDTAMEAVFFDSELDPTIAETNVVSSKVSIGTKDIHTGFQKVTFQELRDSAVNIEEKVTKADANSKSRMIEKQIITGNGNGSTGIQGLLAVDHSVGSVSIASAGQDDLEELYFSIPPQYRANGMFLYNDETSRILRRNLKDDVGRSLFDKNITDGVEWDTLLGKKAVVSQYMPDDLILFFVPEHYMLRLVSGQSFQVITERFAPHKGWLGYLSFGGAWLGPTGANGTCQSLTLTS